MLRYAKRIKIILEERDVDTLKFNEKDYLKAVIKFDDLNPAIQTKVEVFMEEEAKKCPNVTVIFLSAHI